VVEDVWTILRKGCLGGSGEEKDLVKLCDMGSGYGVDVNRRCGMDG
jgi:hypothetical protein